VTVKRRITMGDGEVFEDVSRVAEPNRGDTDLVHIHQEGKRDYLVVDPDDIEEYILINEHGESL